MISRQGDRVNIQRLCSRVSKDCKTAKVMCKSRLSSNVFESIKGSWITIEAGYCKQSGEATGEGTARIVIEAPELMDCRETLKHGTIERTQEWLLMKVPPSFNTRPQHFRVLVHHGWIAKYSSSHWLKPKRLVVCIVEGEPEKRSRHFGGVPRNSEWILDVRYQVIYTFGVWFCTIQVMTVPWFFLLEVRKYLTFY